MSIILDALRKSDAERQRQNAPGIASIPTGPTQHSGGRWVWILVLRLVLNLGAVVYLIKRPGDEPAAAPTERAAVPATPIDRSPAADEPTADMPVAAKPSASPPASIDREPGLAVETAPPATRESVEPGLQRLPAATATAEPVSTPPPRPTVTDGLPTFNELRAQGQLQLPDLHIDIHVYSGNPADRFVFVNMSKYKENARLAEGPILKEITPDGVVLDYLGKTFLLPRE
jgi:general secretion pathway protein B